MRTLIAEHTIPGTDSTIRIERIVPAPSLREAPYFSITREAGPGFASLSCGRPTEPEARQAANELWTDAVRRAR